MSERAQRGRALPAADPSPVRDAALDDAALDALAVAVLTLGARALLLGSPGSGKSSLAARLGASLQRAGHVAACIGADPGSPAFGAPGAVCLGRWHGDGWDVVRVEALCTLDAGRFRLPLAGCVGRLARQAPEPLLVDGPGVVRGVAGAELLEAIVAAADVRVVVHVARDPVPPLLAGALRALGLPVLDVTAAPAARRPGKSARARSRTRLWDEHLAGAGVHRVDVTGATILGTPPPLEAPEQWRGRQVAVLAGDGSTAAMGEVEEVSDGAIRVRAHALPRAVHALLVRDARREADGRLGSAGPDAADAVRYVPPPDVLPDAVSATGPRPVVRASPFTAALVNGVLGDPLLHLRLHHRRRSLLLDLGEAGRLPAKVTHQVSDVFLSHAHVDHIAGFLWLLRSRLGDLPALRVFGPWGIAAHVEGLLAGILWDRIESRGPRFHVVEFDGERARRVMVQAGGETGAFEEHDVAGGVLLEEPDLLVRADALDHGHGTHVLAFAVETPRTLKVRSERLEARSLAPGPWLTRLKALAAAGDDRAPVPLPDGSEAPAGVLAGDLLMETPGIRLAYATDLADTPSNRERLAALSAGAHTLFCEASFRLCDEAQARRTGHLTTRACGEIAARAGVERLVPFHFSRRYEDDLAPCYDEVRAAFARTVTPPLRDTGG